MEFGNVAGSSLSAANLVRSYIFLYCGISEVVTMSSVKLVTS